MHEYIETYWPRISTRILSRLIEKQQASDSGGYYCRFPTDEQKILLTFDDGPTPFGTRVLLDLLARHQVKATFFVIGQNAVRYPELILEMLAAGHVVGNHSFDHLNPWKNSTRKMMRDYEKCNEVLASITNQQPQWARPPFGSANRRTIQWCQRNGLNVVTWDVSLADTKTRRSISELRMFTMRHLKPGSILRLHDSQKSLRITPAFLDSLIPRLKNEGWAFETMSSQISQPSAAA